MTLKQRAAKGIVWSVIEKWGRAAIWFIIFTMLSRLLTPEAFGLVALATAFTTFVEIFMNQGFSSAIIQRLELEEEHLDTAFWISVIMGTLMMICTIMISGLIASLFGEPQLALILIWLSISFLFTALSSTQMAILQRRLAFKSLAARSLIATLLGGIVGISMAFAGFGVWSLVGQNLAMGLIGVIVLWRASDWRPRFRVSKKHYKELFSFGISILGNNMLRVLMQRSDNFLIGYFLGTTVLGYYTIGSQLLRVIMRLVTGITNSVAFPTFSRIQNKPEKLRRAFYNVTQYTSLLAFPVFIGLGTLAPELIPAFFGEKWGPSIPVMQVLALMGILQSVLFFNGSVMRASGKPSWEFGFMFLNALCSVIGFLVAVHWGIVAVAAAYVIVGYLLAPFSYLAVQKLIQINFRSYLHQFVIPLSASVIMVIFMMGLKYIFNLQELNLFIQLAIYLPVGVFSYLLFMGLMARSLSRQVLELVTLAFPSFKLKKT